MQKIKLRSVSQNPIKNWRCRQNDLLTKPAYVRITYDFRRRVRFLLIFFASGPPYANPHSPHGLSLHPKHRHSWDVRHPEPPSRGRIRKQIWIVLEMGTSGCFAKTNPQAQVSGDIINRIVIVVSFIISTPSTR